MIETTIDRIARLIPRENICVVTNKAYVELIQKLEGIRGENVFEEPLNRETATCIGLAAVKLLKRDPKALMVALPADHVIIGEDRFEQAVLTGIKMAEEGEYLVTLGIKPERPESGYGYIEKGTELKPGIFSVKRFVEKPNVEVARSFLDKGSYLWNSGMFIWRADRLLREIKKYLPELYGCLMRIYNAVGSVEEESITFREYEKIDGISIDFGVMQRTNKAVVLQTDFVWDDIGSFNSLERFLNRDESGNIISDSCHEFIDVRNSIVVGNGDRKLIAAIGIKDLLIVDTEDVLLVCPRERSQEIKDLVSKLVEEEAKGRFI